MKYDQVNWLEWPGSPDKQIFDDWVKARKSKKHPELTNTVMRKYSAHVAKAVQEGVCDINEAFEYAAEGGWRAIFYQYIITAKSKEMDMFSGVKQQEAIRENRSTRDMSLDEELNDNSWAH